MNIDWSTHILMIRKLKDQFNDIMKCTESIKVRRFGRIQVNKNRMRNCSRLDIILRELRNDLDRLFLESNSWRDIKFLLLKRVSKPSKSLKNMFGRLIRIERLSRIKREDLFRKIKTIIVLIEEDIESLIYSVGKTWRNFRFLFDNYKICLKLKSREIFLG